MSVVPKVLQRILDSAAIDHGACAIALGLDNQTFAEMLAGQREIPESMTGLIAAVLGINESVLGSPARHDRGADPVPAIWYKLRKQPITDADREYVLAVRQLAYYQHELELVTDTRPESWKAQFDEVSRRTDRQASPTEQGRQAARLFRRITGLDHGATGIGEVFRGYLRNAGVLVIESSARDSVLEGCSFYVGPSGSERPCLFANSYGVTWFRRNSILMHELAHAIFDVESAIAKLDLSKDESRESVEEKRADAFAQEALIPAEVLRHVAQRERISLDDNLDAQGLAVLMARTHVEQRVLAKAIFALGDISEESRASLESCDLAAYLREASTHALSTTDFRRIANSAEVDFRRRTTTKAPRKILLPLRYVGAVLAAIKSQAISRGKAASMLMIDEFEFNERFGVGPLAFVD